MVSISTSRLLPEFFFVGTNGSNRLLNYTPPAVVIRLLTTNGLIAYITSWVLYLSGASSDPRLLLPAWISITTVRCSLPPTVFLYLWDVSILTFYGYRLLLLSTTQHKTMQPSSAKPQRLCWLYPSLASLACPLSWCSCIWPEKMNRRSLSSWLRESYGTGLLQYFYACELRTTVSPEVNCSLKSLRRSSFAFLFPMAWPLVLFWFADQDTRAGVVYLRDCRADLIQNWRGAVPLVPLGCPLLIRILPTLDRSNLFI